MKEKAINFLRVFTKPFRIIADFILFKVYFNFKNNYKILEPFKHQEVLIVGNGPSLKKTPLSKINMVSRKDMDNLEERHVLHALAIAKVVKFEEYDFTGGIIRDDGDKNNCFSGL